MNGTIIQWIGDGNKGGAPYHVLDLSKGLVKRGWRVTVICPPGWLEKECQKVGIEVKTVEITGAFDKEARQKIAKLLKGFREEKILLHCHGVRAGIAGRLAAEKMGISLVYTEHLWTKEYKTPSYWRGFSQLWVLKVLDKKTCRTIAPSKAVADFLIEKSIITEGKIKIIPHGVELPKLSFHPQKKTTVIGTIGALLPVKGQIYLIEALKNLPAVSLWILGSGPLEEVLKKKILASRLGGQIKIWEDVEEEEFFRSIDIYVQPSLSESFGLAVIKAMAYNLPVVASDVGGLKELVLDPSRLGRSRLGPSPDGRAEADGKTGFLVEPANPTAIVQAVKKLLDDKKMAQKMGVAGRKRVEKYFTIDRMMKETEEVYQKCFNR